MDKSVVLHTKHHYNEDIGIVHVFSMSDFFLDYSYDFLRKKEAEFYNWLGESTYVEFRNKLRSIFAEAGKDKEVFDRFKKGNLNSLINKALLAADLEGQYIELHFQEPISQDINVDFNHTNPGGTMGRMTVSLKGKMSIGFEWNENNIKRLLNAVLNRHGFTRFKEDTKTKNMRNVMDNLENMLFNKQNLDSIISYGLDVHGQPVDISQDFKRINSAFGYTNQQIEDAIADPAKRQHLINAKQEVYDFIMNQCAGGSSALKRAAQATWNTKIGKGNSDQCLRNFLFFSKGRNTSGAKGALQEFASAMLLQYIDIVTHDGIIRKIAEIVGNIVGGKKEQPKTDVEMFKSIGIQVKAYNPESLFYENKKGEVVKRLMETNIHPDALDQAIADSGLQFNSNLGHAIVQHIFNASNEYEDGLIEKALYNVIIQAMNMASNEITKDTVCFYIVDVTQLIPASIIVGRFRSHREKPEITITSSYPKERDDAYYAQDAYPFDGRVGPNFLQFWRGFPAPENMHPTEHDLDNAALFQDLYTKRISIRVKFDYEWMFNQSFSVY